MRSKTAKWFECKVQYEQVQDDSLQKRVTEQYVVNALSYTEAEQRITEEMSAFISGEFDIKDIKQATYKEVFFMSEGEKMFEGQVRDLTRAAVKGDKEEGRRVYDRKLEDYPTDTRWYKAKLQFITIDEKTEHEKRSAVTYLVQAASLRNAIDNVDKVMQGTMIDYVQANVGETQIIDVFEESAADLKAAELMARMAEDLRSGDMTVEQVVDKYVSTATPELRQQLIDKLTKIREKLNADGETDGKSKAAGE